MTHAIMVVKNDFVTENGTKVTSYVGGYRIGNKAAVRWLGNDRNAVQEAVERDIERRQQLNPAVFKSSDLDLAEVILSAIMTDTPVDEFFNGEPTWSPQNVF